MGEPREAIGIVNRIAPEHLELLTREAESLGSQVEACGAIFFGSDSCEAVGDYFAGPNHVLPTGGSARFASPLGVYDFVKRTNLVKYTRPPCASIMGPSSDSPWPRSSMPTPAASGLE